MALNPYSVSVAHFIHEETEAQMGSLRHPASGHSQHLSPAVLTPKLILFQSTKGVLMRSGGIQGLQCEGNGRKVVQVVPSMHSTVVSGRGALAPLSCPLHSFTGFL